MRVAAGSKKIGLDDRRAPAAVRRIARALLADLRRARKRLDAKDDPTALHGFRVALRRVRSAVHTYGDVADGLNQRKPRRALKRLARATAPARDAEVGLAWLARKGKAHSAAEEAVRRRLMAEWKIRRDAAYKDARRAVRDRFAGLETRLGRALRASRSDAGAPPFRQIVARLVRAQVAALASALGAVASAFDARAIHAARIQGKHLRYLLEPLANEIPNGATLVKSLKRLQDDLGELCDRQVLSEELIVAAVRYDADRLAGELRALLHDDAQAHAQDQGAAAGLLEVAHRLRAERQQRFDAIARRYLGEHTRRFLAPFRAAAAKLAAD